MKRQTPSRRIDHILKPICLFVSELLQLRGSCNGTVTRRTSALLIRTSHTARRPFHPRTRQAATPETAPGQPLNTVGIAIESGQQRAEANPEGHRAHRAAAPNYDLQNTAGA